MGGDKSNPLHPYGKLHYQCYFEFENKVRLYTLQKQFPNTFWSPRFGTCLQAIEYCSKEETRMLPPDVFGTPSCEIIEANKKKTKKPLEEACKLIQNEGITMDNLAKAMPSTFVVHRRGLEALKQAAAPERNHPTQTIVLYGMPNSGKSRLAYELARQCYEEHQIFKYDSKGQNTQEWWDGISTDTRCVIIDEMYGRKFHFDRFLTITDRFPCHVPIKGGDFKFNPDVIIVTSNFPPSEWWPDLTPMQKLALHRRFSDTRKFCSIKKPDGTFVKDDDGSIKHVFVQQPDEMRDPNTERFYNKVWQLEQDNGFVVDDVPDIVQYLSLVVEDARPADDFSQEELDDFVNSKL